MLYIYLNIELIIFNDPFIQISYYKHNYLIILLLVNINYLYEVFK